MLSFIYHLLGKTNKKLDEVEFQLLDTTDVIRRKDYDTSVKNFEVLRKVYRYDKYSRQPVNIPQWEHYRYYKTYSGAVDGCRDLKNSWYDRIYRDYPAMGNPENENKYPHIKPTIQITRYKAVMRDDIDKLINKNE